MANERKTENIVRSHFEKFNDIIRIEEQTSGDMEIWEIWGHWEIWGDMDMGTLPIFLITGVRLDRLLKKCLSVRGYFF